MSARQQLVDEDGLSVKWKVRFGGEWFSNVYYATIWCGNCHNDVQICILKGVLRSEVDLSKLECGRCGCKTMKLERP
jgi:hypothetical protein